jgi:phospholipid transport system transporter-binding protein
VDSSAVSLLLGWMRVARQKNHELQIESLPESMVSLAGLYGVSELLPAQAG